MTPLQPEERHGAGYTNPTHSETTATATAPHLPKNFLKALDFFLVSGEEGRGAPSRDLCGGTPARSKCSVALRSASAEENAKPMSERPNARITNSHKVNLLHTSRGTQVRGAGRPLSSAQFEKSAAERGTGLLGTESVVGRRRGARGGLGFGLRP